MDYSRVCYVRNCITFGHPNRVMVQNAGYAPKILLHIIHEVLGIINSKGHFSVAFAKEGELKQMHREMAIQKMVTFLILKLMIQLLMSLMN